MLLLATTHVAMIQLRLLSLNRNISTLNHLVKLTVTPQTIGTCVQLIPLYKLLQPNLLLVRYLAFILQTLCNLYVIPFVYTVVSACMGVLSLLTTGWWSSVSCTVKLILTGIKSSVITVF
jgi:hypothetical protein